MTRPDVLFGSLLAGLTEEQREAVTVDAAPLLVLAGAGSGKTRVLTRRIAWHAADDRIDPRRTLAVTFTRKAAGELTRRLRDLGVEEHVTAGTFHALALAQLRRRWLDQGRQPPKLLDRKTRLLGRLVERGDGGLLAAAAREIEWAQARLLDPDAYESVARRARPQAPLPPGQMAALYDDYRREKRRRGLIDFDDLLTQCAQAIEDDTEFAAAIHWRFRHLFVDEFQDVNAAQFRLLQAWLGGRRDLFAVGDDEQAIYGFGGADARYVVDFTAHFGEASVVRLTANFRSTPQILALANAVLSPGAEGERPLRAVGIDGPAPVITAYDADFDEAAATARTIDSLQRDGVAYRSMAVLARTNAQLEILKDALGAARIPAQVRGARRFFDRAVVQHALRDLASAAEQSPGLPFEAHLEAVEALADTTVGRSDPAALSSVLDVGREYVAVDGDTASLDGFTAYLATAMRGDDPAPNENAVDVLTFHRAKGLEWPVVFVTGLEDGFVPISHAATPPARDEERRLLHVALTRAERHLFLSWSRQRTFGERTVKRERSPFLPVLEQRLPPPEPEPTNGDRAPSPGRAAFVAAASELRERSPLLPPIKTRERGALYVALADWRERRARAAGVPVEAILDDTTLRTISETRPADEDGLRELPGIGTARLARYGPEILEVVSGYAEE